MAKERIRAKHAEAAQLRAEQERRKRRKKLVSRSVGGLVLVVVVGSAGVCAVRNRQLTSAVTTATYTGGQHVAGSITYKESPPIGGLHNVVWQNCGIYEVPIHSEHAVHSLEHGAVWLTYQPGLPSDQVRQLRVLASDDFMLLSPYPGLASPIVASSWNHQLSVESASDGRLTRFIAQFKNNPTTTPEFGAPCVGGTSVSAEADSLKTAPGPTAP